MAMLQNALLSLFTGILGSFIGYFFWPRLRSYQIRASLEVEDNDVFTGGLFCRVSNKSPFTMGKVIPYITIKYDSHDVLEPPSGKDAYQKPQNYNARLTEAQLCWATQEGGVNPVRIDIYSGEKQSLFLGDFNNEYIQIFSEKCNSPARVFLSPKKYKGKLKLVCMDCRAKEFDFIIDPNASYPVRFQRRK